MENGDYPIYGVELDEDIMSKNVKANVLGHSVSVATKGGFRSKTLEFKRE